MSISVVVIQLFFCLTRRLKSCNGLFTSRTGVVVPRNQGYVKRVIDWPGMFTDPGTLEKGFGTHNPGATEIPTDWNYIKRGETMKEQ